MDAISFGLAPAMIMYFAVLNREGWDWLFVFIYVAVRGDPARALQRRAGGPREAHFHGLPSPAAGMTLATYYWFSQTPLYNETILGDLPVAFLAALPDAGARVPDDQQRAVSRCSDDRLQEDLRQILGSLVVVGTHLRRHLSSEAVLFSGARQPTCSMASAKTVFFGLIGRLPRGDIPVISDDDEEFEVGRTDPAEILVPTSRPVPQQAASAGGNADARIRARTSNRPRDFPPQPAAPGRGPVKHAIASPVHIMPRRGSSTRRAKQSRRPALARIRGRA